MSNLIIQEFETKLGNILYRSLKNPDMVTFYVTSFFEEKIKASIIHDYNYTVVTCPPTDKDIAIVANVWLDLISSYEFTVSSTRDNNPINAYDRAMGVV